MLFVSNKIRLAILHANDRENIYSYKWMPMGLGVEVLYGKKYILGTLFKRSARERHLFFLNIVFAGANMHTWSYRIRDENQPLCIFIRYIVFRCICLCLVSLHCIHFHLHFHIVCRAKDNKYTDTHMGVYFTIIPSCMLSGAHQFPLCLHLCLG